MSVDRVLLSNFSGLAEEFSLLGPQQETGARAEDKDGDVDMTAASAIESTDVQKEWGLGLVVAEGGGEKESAESTRAWVLKKLLEEMAIHTRAEVGRRGEFSYKSSYGCFAGRLG